MSGSEKAASAKNEAQELAEIEAQELATIEAEMAAAAQEMQDNLVVSTNRISNRGKQFTLPDGTIMGPTLEVVILGYIRANALFSSTYDPNSPEAPICFAFAKPGDELKPSSSVEKPEAETCDDCPNDEFGTALVGKGKACKNEYQVAVLVPSHSETEIMTLSISATGLKSFDTSLRGAMKIFGHTAQAILTAEFTDAMFPVVKITGGKPNPDAVKHFRMAKDAVQTLLEQ